MATNAKKDRDTCSHKYGDVWSFVEGKRRISMFPVRRLVGRWQALISRKPQTIGLSPTEDTHTHSRACRLSL